MTQNTTENLPLGLTDAQVLHSRESHGENRPHKRKRKSLLASFLENFGDPMIKVLLIALAINVIFLFNKSDWFESLGIAVAILLATVVSTLSEYGSESSFEKLQEEASRLSCRVKRATGIALIPIEQVVVGDIVLLQAGDRIPADGVIIRGNVDVDQSALNGESKEAKKSPADKGDSSFEEGDGTERRGECFSSNSKRDLLDHTKLFSGTIVCAGEGVMSVTEVGEDTFYGSMAREIQEDTRESPLKVRLSEFAGTIGKFGYLAASLVAIVYLFNVVVLDNQFNTALILSTLSSPEVMLGHALKAATIAVTIIVMAVPEGLPMMITVVLSSNMKQMLKDNVLVRKLVGIETAGSLNILFTDKTGTITRGKLDVTHFISGAGRIWTRNEIITSDMRLKGVLRDSVRYNCSAVFAGVDTDRPKRRDHLLNDANNAITGDSLRAIGGNATDRAALEFTAQLGDSGSKIKRGEVVPFSSENKFMATAVSGSRNVIFIKGATEKILPLCTSCYDEFGKIVPLTNKTKINNILKEFANQAVRIIAVAESDNGATPLKPERCALRLVGFLGIRDEVRIEAVEAVRQVQAAGVQTVMITGDARLTALAIAKEAGIVKKGSDIVMTSEEINALTDEQLSDLLPNLRVVARALPSDKSRLVRIAQAKNLVVGMTGDGVNDAPALKRADVGFSMGSGTEVAKEASDIVILDDNFMSISKAICYGRTIFKSIRKFIIYQVSISMGAVGISLVGPFIGVDSPVTVIQMLWINIVMDTLAGLAFSGEKARAKYMSEPPKPRDEPIVNRYMQSQIAVCGVYIALICFVFLKAPIFQNTFLAHGSIYMMTAFFALFMFMAIFTSFNARTHEINPLDRLATNRSFVWIMSLVTVIQIIIVYRGGTLFRTMGLRTDDMLLIVALAFTIIPVDMLRKHIFSMSGEVAGT